MEIAVVNSTISPEDLGESSIGEECSCASLECFVEHLDVAIEVA